MKKTISILVLFCTTTFIYAQDQMSQRPKPPTAKEMIKKATKELALSDEQITLWEEIHEKYESSMKDQSKANDTRKQMGEELEATLTKEQSEKFQEMRKSQGPPPKNN
jgi:CO dehydrogenase/acetyl-CoA synthase epsilon subunit